MRQLRGNIRELGCKLNYRPMVTIGVTPERWLVLEHGGASAEELPILNSFHFLQEKLDVGPYCIRLENGHELQLDAN